VLRDKEVIVDNITFEEFKKLELKVAEIKTVEDIEGADKIYKLTVDCGEERVLVAGIKPWYTKEELVGKKVAMVANLEPRTIRGVESHGMVLAASNSDRSALTVLTVDKEVPKGSGIS
jgi:methionyl-tRNA synthetase